MCHFPARYFIFQSLQPSLHSLEATNVLKPVMITLPNMAASSINIWSYHYNPFQLDLSAIRRRTGDYRRSFVDSGIVIRVYPAFAERHRVL